MRDLIKIILREYRGGHNKLTRHEFIDRSKKAHTNEDGTPKYDYSLVDYVDSNTKVKVICPEHGEFEVWPSKHMKGENRCPLESKRGLSKYSDSELSGEAEKYKTTAEFKRNSQLFYNAALKRGKDFYDEITSHFVLEKESSGEKLVANILVNLGLISPSCLDKISCPNREKTFEDCVNSIKGRYCRKLRFDFYLPELNTIIEVDGEQHFRPSTKFGGEKFKITQENDKIKDIFCREKNINLIRIHYKFPSNKIETAIIDAIENPKPLTLIGDY